MYSEVFCQLICVDQVRSSYKFTRAKRPSFRNSVETADCAKIKQKKTILFRCILASVDLSVGRLSLFFESRKRKVGKHAGGRIVVPQVLVFLLFLTSPFLPPCCLWTLASEPHLLPLCFYFSLQTSSQFPSPHFSL